MLCLCLFQPLLEQSKFGLRLVEFQACFVALALEPVALMPVPFCKL
jgi:hypothetical protein